MAINLVLLSMNLSSMGVTGILCDDGVAPLTVALERLIKNQNLRVTMGQAGRDRMKQFSPESIWGTMGKLIETGE